MTAIVCGVDYSLKALDVALVRGRELISTHCYDLGRDETSRTAQMQRACLMLRDAAGGPCTIVLEKPWMAVGKGLKTAQALHEIPTAFRAIATTYGHTVEYVVVATWRRQVLGKGNLKTDAAKAKAIWYCETIYKMTPESHNEADAVCLATYGAQQAARRELVGA
jgi:hypothetical protein